MKKNYIKPVVKAYKISTSTILAGSGDPKVSSSQAESGSEGLAKYGGWFSDEDK